MWDPVCVERVNCSWQVAWWLAQSGSERLNLSQNFPIWPRNDDDGEMYSWRAALLSHDVCETPWNLFLKLAAAPQTIGR